MHAMMTMTITPKKRMYGAVAMQNAYQYSVGLQYPGVVGGLCTVLGVLICCRYCCAAADTRRHGTALLRKRSVTNRSMNELFA